MNITNRLVEDVKKYVFDLFDKKLSHDLLFHSRKHTIDVLRNSEIIGKYSKLNESDLNILRICALFHDLGYINIYEGHEAESARYAAEFLKSKNTDESTIRIIAKSILATKIPQDPKSTIAEMLCDADLMHLTNNDYFNIIDLMRREWANIGKANLNEKEFHLQSIDFFYSHHYFSEYGRKVLEPKKEKTLQKIKKRLLNLK